MKHLGDITKIHGDQIEPVDCITGGSPCQDLSVAGLRKGLAGERSGLFMEQIRIVKEMRAHDRADGRTGELVRPRFMVWENVPGALSSGSPKGEDFRIVLEEAARVAEPSAVIPGPPGGRWENSGCIVGQNWSLAWRIHDAQYWGVPQRRRRICMLCDFNGHTAPEILFDAQLRREAESSEYNQIEQSLGNGSEQPLSPFPGGLPRDSEPCIQTGEGTPKGAGESLGRAISFQERAGKPGGGQRNTFAGRENRSLVNAQQSVSV